MNTKSITVCAFALAVALSGCSPAPTGRELILRDCLEDNGVDIATLDVSLDRSGNILVVSGVPDAMPEVVDGCLEEASA